MKNLYINGCSFTAGDNLKDEESWPYKLAQLSNTKLYNNSVNGQSFGSIFTNTINHLTKLDNTDTNVVIGLTWPHRHYFTYNGWNINVTNADFPNPRYSSKINHWRRMSSPNHLDTYTDEATVTVSLFNGESIPVVIKTQSMEDVLVKADFISLHVPAQKDYVIDATAFSKMKKGAAIVNAARGGVIDEVALVEALDSGQLSFAALDTFENEPKPEIKLLMHDKISLTPHIGAATLEAQDRIGEELASQISSLLK